jgi:hypothetical protein
MCTKKLFILFASNVPDCTNVELVFWGHKGLSFDSKILLQDFPLGAEGNHEKIICFMMRIL